MRWLLPFLAVLTWAEPAWAVGCVRATCSTMGEGGSPYVGAGAWRLQQGYRFFMSHRHFVGDVEQPNRATDGSEVVNTVHFADVGLVYGLSDRVSLALGLPLQLASRSSPLRDPAGAVLERNVAWAAGPGDLVPGVRAWLVDPHAAHDYNLELGLGLKVPSGARDLTTARRVWDPVTAGPRTAIQTIDPSIQPGDGGWGGVFQAAGFWQATEPVGLYADGTYVLNPMNHAGVPSFQRGAGEELISVADSYQLRLGGGYALAGTGVAVTLGGRLDGVPVADLVGASEGFRRPGVVASLDPGVSYGWGRQAVALNVAVPIYRNRLRSLADLANGTAGDAAFADFLVGASYSVSFGGDPM